MPLRVKLLGHAAAALLVVALAACGQAEGQPAPTAPPAQAAVTSAAATGQPTAAPTATAATALPTAAPAATEAPPAGPATAAAVATIPPTAPVQAPTAPAAVRQPTATLRQAQVTALPAETLAGNTGEVAQAIIDAIKADLAARLGADPAGFSVLVDEAVVWPDGSMGCPQPGVMYPQVLVEGFRVILGADGQQYAYHGDGGGKFFLCENPARQP